MKILYIVPSLKKKGPIEVLYNIVSNISNEEIYILQIVNEVSGAENKDRFDSLDNVKLYTLCNKGLKKDILKISGKLKKTVNKINPDIIHSHCLLPDILTAFFLGKYLRVSTCHNNPHVDYSMKANLLISKVMITMQLLSFKKMDRVATISKYIDKVIKKNIPKTKLIYNGISEDIYINDINKLESNKLKEKYSLPTDKKIIISVASLIKRKNIELLVEAFLKLNPKDAILVLVGEGNEKDAILSMTQSNNNVYLLGHQQKVNEILNISDLLVSLSHSEGFSLIVAEANSVGLPMILSNIPPHLEQFEENQLKDERICFVNLDKSLSDNLPNILAKMLSEFGGQKVNKLQNKFKSSFMASSYLDLYNNLIKSKK